jgi:peptidoglycan/LPS O-acetylase OafA/YrhL
MLNRKRQANLFRWAVVVISLMLAIPAAIVIWSGSPIYPNVWGGMVFAPLALLGGVVLFLLALFRPSVFRRSYALHGKPVQTAKQAERSRRAVKAFDKPGTGGV